MAELFHAFGVEWKLLLAQAVNFAVVLGALWYFLYRPLARVLEKRRGVIAQGVADAAQAKETLDGAASEASETIAAAQTEADRVLAGARTTAGTERAKLLKEAEVRAALLEEDARLKALETKAQALKESEKEIARLAVLAAGKVLEQN